MGFADDVQNEWLARQNQQQSTPPNQLNNQWDNMLQGGDGTANWQPSSTPPQQLNNQWDNMFKYGGQGLASEYDNQPRYTSNMGMSHFQNVQRDFSGNGFGQGGNGYGGTVNYGGDFYSTPEYQNSRMPYSGGMNYGQQGLPQPDNGQAFSQSIFTRDLNSEANRHNSQALAALQALAEGRAQSQFMDAEGARNQLRSWQMENNGFKLEPPNPQNGYGARWHDPNTGDVYDYASGDKVGNDFQMQQIMAAARQKAMLPAPRPAYNAPTRSYSTAPVNRAPVTAPVPARPAPGQGSSLTLPAVLGGANIAPGLAAIANRPAVSNTIGGGFDEIARRIQAMQQSAKGSNFNQPE